jgi:hypothetical protein
MIRKPETTYVSNLFRFMAPLAIVMLVVLGAAPEVRAQAGDAAVQLDATSGPTSGTGTTLTWSHTVGTNANRWLVVGVALNNNLATNGYQVSSITWQANGFPIQNLSSLIVQDSQVPNAQPPFQRVEIWDLGGSNGSPNSGPGTITVTLNKSVAAVAGAVSMWNVQGKLASSSLGSTNQRTNVSASVSSQERDGVIAFFAIPGGNTATVADSVQSPLYTSPVCTGSCTSSDLLTDAGTAPGIDGVQTLRWNLGAASYITWCIVDYYPYNPTVAHVRQYSALPTPNGMLVRWTTSYEYNNLGFRVLREGTSGMIQVTPSLIAGSALFAGQGVALTAGRSYQWLDTSNTSGTGRYWLQEVSLDGTTRLDGPIIPEAGSLAVGALSIAPATPHNSVLLRALGVSASSASTVPSVLKQRVTKASASTLDVQWQLAGMAAARIGVQQDGWYRIGKADLLAAGFDPGNDPSALRLFNNGIEQAISVVGGPMGTFDSNSYIEFYGTGLDTPSTDTNVYWLVKAPVTAQAPRRIQTAASVAGTPATGSYIATVERRDRTVYFAALMDTTRDNYFGPTITSDGAQQVLTLDHISAEQIPSPALEVAVQGATSSAHQVSVSLNGHSLGEIDFSGIMYKTARFAVDPSFLLDGNNTVNLVALGNSTDVSLVDYARITYVRQLYAAGDSVDFTGAPLQAVTARGFTTPHVRVIDLSIPNSVVELPGAVSQQKDGYAVTATPLPVYQGPGPQSPSRLNTLFAFTEEQAKRPAWIEANTPSQWHAASNAADLVIITHRDFEAAANALAAQRTSQGLVTQVIDVQAAYDEFSYGDKDPQAIRDLLARASTTWKRPPTYVLLFGDATSDPRNYLGDAMTDFVPTKMVPIEVLKSASDDWFVDFNDTGFPQMAIGRIPVQTEAQAETVVNKLIAYDAMPTGAGWTKDATFVADTNDPNLLIMFDDATHQVEQHVPTALNRDEILAGSMDPSSAHAAVISAFNSGSLLVNYVGHGSDTMWATNGLFTAADATALGNGSRLPVVGTLNCLNGLFEDPSTDSLGEALLKAPSGGAVAVLASTALTNIETQLVLGNQFYDALFGANGLTVGQALMAAKTSSVDESTRKCYVLLGDPSMRLHK